MQIDRLIHALAFPVLAFLAAARSRTQPSHRSVAVLFAICAAGDLTRHVLGTYLDAHAPPYTGSLLVAYFADNAAYLAINLAAPLIVLHHFAGVSPRALIASWALLVLAFVAWKQALWLPSVQFHDPVSLVATLLACGAVARAVLASSDRITLPDSSHVVLVVELAGEVVSTAVLGIEPMVGDWIELRTLDFAVHSLIAMIYGGLAVRDVRARRRAHAALARGRSGQSGA